MSEETAEELKQCPACGGRLSPDGESDGLCLACLFELALESPSILAELDDVGEAETLAYSAGGALSPGAILGGRYRVRALLGRGGMGEVWRAFDLKLRVDVALKALRAEWLESERALETLRQEVRSAREVVSPHVCRVFDLIEVGERELVSMEYIDGITLWDILRARAPLELTEAREIALQFLAGLEAIHAAGLVHRDIKPENIMMTRSGRVVVMDFGIAKALAEGRTGTVSGTPAYMAPEQARGDSGTSRADVFSSGVVLAEMVTPDGLRTFEERQRLWRGVHREPPEVADTAWAPVLVKALAGEAKHRHAGASAFARALEEVTLRVADAETVHPYPGLAAFTKEDAEYFFGRELEVEEMWKKLRRPHLLGLIGPSGAGKSSFLRAGLLPVIPTGWRAVVTAPGSQPFTALAQALLPELGADTEAMQKLLRFEEPEVAVSLVRRWREQHDEVLVIVDQFEELFTQNPADIQTRFAELLGRLALEADVRVLVAMRDDFLFHCSSQPALGPMFSELTPLRPPLGAALRRALVQPALKCGYRFEDEELVEEMVAEVTAERGALPLLAFAASRLWDHRDRDQGLLTREAYEHIRGVGGALAQHAEASLETIGHDHLPVVRELFRNLVTAQGTRAAREEEELLSVFDGQEREAARKVLGTLVDARLLTTYEESTDTEEDAPRKRIEIIHESLLSNWPRLVRWRTQDADSAQLRDQLRQVAQLWVERGQPEDLLWTGTSFKEYELWRERYEGGLSDSEEEFAGAMKERATRRRRMRRLAVAAVVTVAVAVASVTSLLWREARNEARRAEAQKLLALGQLELETVPTSALAYATASLKLANTPEARLFVLRALAAGPPATVLQLDQEVDRGHDVVFSPDGAWAALKGYETIQVVSRDGQTHRSLESFPSTGAGVRAAFGSQGRYLFGAKAGELRVWSVPEFELVERQEIPEGNINQLHGTPEAVFTLTTQGNEEVIQAHSVGDPPRLVGRVEAGRLQVAVDRSGEWLAFASGNEVYARSIEDWDRPPLRLGSHAEEIHRIDVHSEGSVAVVGESGETSIWSIQPEAEEPVRTLPSRLWATAVDLPGRILANWGKNKDGLWVDLWNLETPLETLPTVMSVALPLMGLNYLNGTTFEPKDQWLVTGNVNAVGFWPLEREGYRVFKSPEGPIGDLEFAPDGRHLVSKTHAGEVKLWDLQTGGLSRILARVGSEFSQLDIDRAGRQLVVGRPGGVLVVPLDGGVERNLEGFDPAAWIVGTTIDAAGRLIAASGIRGPRSEKVIRIWDLETGESSTLGPLEEGGEGFDGQIFDLSFLPDGSLVSTGHGGVRVWSPQVGTQELIAPAFEQSKLTVFGAGRYVAYSGKDGELEIVDLETGTVRAVPSHGSIWPIAVDPSGGILVTGGVDGIVRVGPVTGEEPHLLLGHEEIVNAVAISQDGRWIASGGEDFTIRIWPMPDLSKPPLQTLPYEELLAKLHSLTNVRVVEAETEPTGWRVEVGPFPGWEEKPTW